jgi:phosphoglycerate kinase
MIRALFQLELKDKRVFVRVDFNVPLSGGKITETHRIDSTLPTLRAIVDQAKVTLIASHLGRPGGKRDPKSSLAPVRDYLQQALSRPVTLAPDCVGPEVEELVRGQPPHATVLLENLRFHKEEEANDPGFSRALAALADAYVNDAFGAAHRAHASVAGMVRFFSAKAAGLLLQKEIDYLGQILTSPKRPFVAVIGGAKVSDKIGVLKNLIPKLDALLLGGGMAYTFLKGRGAAIGKSLLEEDRLALARELMAQAENRQVKLLLPTDHVIAPSPKDQAEPKIVEGDIPADQMGLDIGPKTVAAFSQELGRAKMVLWNGPVGLFEEEKFSHGTVAIARSLAGSQAISVIAGGDTVAAARRAGVDDKMTHLSTGGGATLEFLEGKSLPGVQALEEQS